MTAAISQPLDAAPPPVPAQPSRKRDWEMLTISSLAIVLLSIGLFTIHSIWGVLGALVVLSAAGGALISAL